MLWQHVVLCKCNLLRWRLAMGVRRVLCCVRLQMILGSKHVGAILYVLM